MTRVGVLALQGDVREHLAALTELGVDAQAVRRPGELGAVDALILPGGESTAISNLLRAFDLAEPLRARAKSSCFCNLSVTNTLCKGCLIADVPAIVGSLDIVMGEIDR